MMQRQKDQPLEMEPFVDEIENELSRPEGLHNTKKSSSGKGEYHKLSTRARYLLGATGFFLLCSLMYKWDAEMATDKVTKQIAAKPPSNGGRPKARKTRDYGLHEGIFSYYPIISVHEDVGVQSSIVETPAEGDGGACPALCESREEARHKKFGGDLMDLSDVLKIANKAHDKLVEHVKAGYGKYFDGIFIKEPGPNVTKDTPLEYTGIKPVTTDGQSRNRLKRKLQLKVLKMMEALKISEENVHGCNCRTKSGSTTESEDAFTSSIPDHYQKYVFANGGHSNAAGHGNTFKETYTYLLGEDLRIIWDALGVEMIDRNMAMGAMKASPDIATCSQGIFGDDVDLLTWNYAMTDNGMDSYIHYVYRGAVNPGRPALIGIDMAGNYARYGAPLEEIGLSLFYLNGFRVETNKNIPNSYPDEIPLTDEEFKQLPALLQNFLCFRRFENVPCPGFAKWSCTRKKQKRGSNCTCPGVRKRSGWHMGFKAHALYAHYVALPFVEILLEGLSELVATKKDPKTLFQEIQKEEDEEFEAFLSVGVVDKFNATIFERFGELGDLIDTWFKAPSLCRTSLLPSMTRYLGLAANSDKVAGTCRCYEEEYEKGYYFHRNFGVYNYTDRHPPKGEMVINSPHDFRDCWPVDVCSEIVMPDYKDWFYGDWTNGPVSITFPNEKEREYYGYKPGKFKGILGLVSTLFTENVKGNQYDYAFYQWNQYVSAKVNGKPVTNWIMFNRMAILEGADGIYWEPSANNDYTFEFSPNGTLGDGRPASALHFRLQGFVLY